MKHTEKKYLVESFEDILEILREKGAEEGVESTTMHYYAELPGNDVTKLVSKGDKNEIHLLKETDGKFDLTENIPVASIDAGLEWLESHGYKRVGKVKMINTNYEYKTGIVGLYLIDDWLHSIILDFPEGDHEAVEEEFNLQDTEVIKLPYNKYLEGVNELQKVEL